MARRWWIGGAGALLLLGGAAVWWLGQTPLSYEERAGSVDASPPPSPGLRAAADSAENGTAEAHDGAAAAGEESVDELEEPLDLPPEAPPIVRTEAGRTPSFEDTENYLLVGVDRTRGRWFGRADSLAVVVFDDDTGHVGVISLPRDLYVQVPGHGPARINATLRIASRLEEDPLALVQRVVSDTMAMPVDHVVVGDLRAFERTVDRLGGVEVDVPCPIVDNFIDPRTDSGRRLLDVDAGRRHMDGVTAAMYVRSRHGRSDWSRARRQQAVLLGLRDRVRSLGATEWLPVLSDALGEGVTTTMSRFEMIALARRVSRIESEHIHGVLIGYREVTGYRTAEGRAVLLPDFDAIDARLEELFEAPSPGTRPDFAECPDADVALQ